MIFSFYRDSSGPDSRSDGNYATIVADWEEPYGNPGWSQLLFPLKLPGVLVLGATILLAPFFLVSMAEWARRRGAQSDMEALEGL